MIINKNIRIARNEGAYMNQKEINEAEWQKEENWGGPNWGEVYFSKKERVYESIYEGMKQRERIVNPSNDPIPQEQQSYDEYKREREEFITSGN
jgi:hypothetical protein